MHSAGYQDGTGAGPRRPPAGPLHALVVPDGCHARRVPARNRRLPRHLAWPLTSTDLVEVLGDQYASVTWLRFMENSAENVLAVEWVPDRRFNYGHGSFPSLRVDVHAVKAAERRSVRAALRAQALPELRDWIEHAVGAPPTWQEARHYRYWTWTGDCFTGHDYRF
jgi:hypothetical protein